MNQDIKKQWVAALRSGEYKQAKGFLHTPDGFCCLGVLCDLHMKTIGKEWRTIEEGGLPRFAYFEGLTSLPLEVAQWADLKNLGDREYSNDPSVLVDERLIPVSVLNDGVAAPMAAYEPRPASTFLEIADAIEASL